MFSLKKLSFTMILTLVFSGLSLNAQAANPSNVYIKTLYIESIATHTLGYVVNYRTSNGHHRTTYIPGKWFGQAGSKGELVFETNPSVPYMEVVFVDNKFHHVRLHVTNNYSIGNWVVLPHGSDLTKEFSIDTLTLEWN